MNNINTIIIGLVVVLAGSWAWFAYSNGALPVPWGGIGGTACTMEAKICPDGSAVGRSGPNCEFAECPSTTGYGTLQGRVTISPVCPVETLPPDPSCAPKPYSTLISVRSVSGDFATSLQSDPNGSYSIKVKPGTYIVDALGGNPLPSCESVRVTVQSDDVQDMDIFTDISCDSGIR